jgi:hypothetical protein
MRLGGGAYWTLGWLLTLVAVYLGTPYARGRGLVAPVVSGPAALRAGALLCALGLILARRFGQTWAGVLVGGLGIVSLGVGLTNLVRRAARQQGPNGTTAVKGHPPALAARAPGSGLAR